MIWKICMMACVSATIISFPQNIIGCGPEADPYDYYTSFFSQHLASVSTFKPFYYTRYNFLYDEAEPVEVADVLSKEWADYCKQDVTAADTKDFVTRFSAKDVSSIYYNIEKSEPPTIPDSVQRNTMTKYFYVSKDLEALGYILYAKKVEPFVIGGNDSWEAVKRDSFMMARLIKDGLQLLKASKSEVFKLKYAYQVIRLALYSGQYQSAIGYYDTYIPGIKAQGVLQPLSLALKAGALFRTGQRKHAAYLFSKVFLQTDTKRISNYLGFNWSIEHGSPRTDYLALCKDNSEKAAMLSMFILGSPENELPSLEQIYKWQPSLNLLEVLGIREVNKLEEKYFTPHLQKQAGGKEFYYTWSGAGNDSTFKEGQKEVGRLRTLFSGMAQNKAVSNPGLFFTAAAYCAYMSRDYASANASLAQAKKGTLTGRVADQWALTNLLVTVNESPKIDEAFETKILPSLLWLQKKARAEMRMEKGYHQTSEWMDFYRNVMSTIMAKRYHAQGEVYKEVLAIGSADHIYQDGQINGYQNALEYLHNNLSGNEVEKLYTYINIKSGGAYHEWLVKNNSLSKAQVVDFAGTAYLRDYQYAKAIAWFNRSPDASNKFSIHKNPFRELMFDQEERLGDDKGIFTKMAFAKEMLRLEGQSSTDKVRAPEYLYKMAIGMYNMTYYGYTWELVQYYRSGRDGYYIPDHATAFQKEYYGCFSAHNYFKKAMELSANQNFKARCLFMMAKCKQKTIRQPQYFDFGNNGYEKYELALKDYFTVFKNNAYFPQFVKEYQSAPFYKEALTSCSYLRDFIRKK